MRHNSCFFLQKTEAKTEGCCGSTSASSLSKSPKSTDNLFCQTTSLSTADKTQKIIKQNLITTKQSSMIGRSPSCSCRDVTLPYQTPPSFYCGFFNKAHVTLPKCTTNFIVWHNAILLWTFKKSQFKHTDILRRTALHAKNGNGIAQGERGGKKKRKFQEIFDSPIVIH